MPSRFEDGAIVQGDLRVTGRILPERPRTELAQENLASYPIPLTAFRVFDAIQTNLPGTPASDDLGISAGTFGTHSHKLTAGDLKAAGSTTRRARVEFSLPPEYVAGETVQIDLHAGMETTVADTACTVDVEIFVNGKEGLVSGSDLVSTAAQSMNSLTFATKTFAMNSSGLTPGSILDIRISVTCNDAATATAVIASIGAVTLRADIKG